jgi:hypothetical protein
MYALYDHESWFFREVAARQSASELGASLRRLCARPFGEIIHAIPWSYLVPRENEIAMGRQAPDDDDEQLEWLMKYWGDLAGAYRGDGTLLPSESGYTQLVLPPEFTPRLHAELDAGTHDIETVQRTAARLEMMNFVISGEVRGRNFFHGPYEGSRGGTTLIVQEFTELQERQQPWVDGLLEFPMENVAVIREVEDLEVDFDLFGFIVVKSGNYREQIRRAVLVTVDGDDIRRLDDDEIAALTVHAQSAMKGAYKRIAEWDDEYRVMYGIYHYLNEAAPFAQAVGAPELVDQLRDRIEESGARRIGDVRAMGDLPPVWAQWAAGGEPFTLPAVGARSR